MNDYRQFIINALPKKSIGAEIGVHLGDFSQLILDHVSPKRLHLIDPWEYKASKKYKSAVYGGLVGNQERMDKRYLKVCNRFKKNIETNQVEIHRGYSANILQQFPDEYFDWVYIDGNHQYEYVKKDLELSFHKVKTNGWIIGDDYCEGGWWEGGVKRAVDEIKNNSGVNSPTIIDGNFIFLKLNEKIQMERL